MAEPLQWKSKVLLAKPEVTYGTDPTPTQAILAKNVTCKPFDGQDVSRDLERPFRGAQEMFPVGSTVVLEFDVELVGSGTAGTAPAYGPLLRACGLAETISAGVSVAYNPISAGYESTALYFWIGGNRQKVLGARGSATLNVEAAKIPFLHFVITGLYAAPAVTATPAVDFSAFKTPLAASKVNTPTFTLGGTPLVLRSFALDLANDVQPRFLIGRDEIVIVDSNEAISANVEAVALATYDPFAAAATPDTTAALSLVHDTRAGFICAVAAPKCTQRRPNEYANENGVLMWPLKLAPLPSDAGSDQFSITFT